MSSLEADLRVGAADRLAFEEAARECYEHANIPWHGNVVWVSSPLVMALTAPVAALLISLRRCGYGDLHDGALQQAMGTLMLQGSVASALGTALRQGVQQAAPEPPPEAGPEALTARWFPGFGLPAELAVHGAVSGELRKSAGLSASTSGTAALRALRLAVHADVIAALPRLATPGNPLHSALRQVIARGWYRYISGRHHFAFAGLFGAWGEAGADRHERAYLRAGTAACCWYPHRELVVASEWPSELQPELLEAGPNSPAGQALLWGDSWGVYMQGGRRVPQWVITQPQDLTVEIIQEERDKEMRRILIERYGWQRFLRDSGTEATEPSGLPAEEPTPPTPAPPPAHAAAG